MEHLLSVRDLNIDLLVEDGTNRVVSDFSFDLDKGQTLGIVGESGSGKSMTVTAVMGILPEIAVPSGEIIFRGEELLTMSPKTRRQLAGPQIGFIFQEPMSALHPTITIGDQMIRPMRKHLGLSKKDAQARAVEYLDLVGIPPERGVLNAYVHQLSGGMRQRVMIAMAISCDPALLIADEPTTALDTTIQKQILDLIDRLRKELNLGVILISHDLGLVAEYTDDIIVMLDGYQMESGPTEQVVASPQSGYTRGLLESAPKLGRRTDRLPVIDRSLFTRKVTQ